jgi:hypothetical protein
MPEVERALVFGEDAVSYERARPGYPSELIGDVLDLVEPVRVVEVGAGLRWNLRDRVRGRGIRGKAVGTPNLVPASL